MEYFFEQMQNILGTEYDRFYAAYTEKPRHKALRINTRKISVEDFVALAEKIERGGIRSYGLKQNPLCRESFYTSVKPSLDPLYHAGLYYMQEPSASSAVASFAPFVGERVLDLCAAPGGKATQVAALTSGTVVCNEIDGTRRKALIENIERLGITNAVVTGSSARDFVCAGASECFDTLITDVPCSGGGMMRYENVTYTAKTVAGCAARQREILSDAVKLLCRGGYMLYSTCTFAPEENENNIEFLKTLGLSTVDIPLLPGMERGMGEKNARRIYPHNFDGEGHFFCVLKKTDGDIRMPQNVKSVKSTIDVCGARIEYEREKTDVLPINRPDFDLPFYYRGTPVFENIGKHGNAVKNFSYALSHALDLKTENVRTIELGEDGAQKYIRGEQPDGECPYGLYLATVEGYALGWIKSASNGAGGSALKNLYPKNLRIN